jgi:hypothetical protein
VFVTSTQSNANLGGLSGADSTCNTLAGAAGLSGTFVAWLSSTTTNASARLQKTGTTARGWVNMDGSPFADTVGDIATGVVYYPIVFTENYATTATRVDGRNQVWTGTYVDGTYTAGNVATCSDWTTSDAGAGNYGTSGQVSGGPGRWTDATGAQDNCASQRNLYCFQVDYTNSVSVPSAPAGSKLIYATNAKLTPGTSSPDTLCTNEAPGGKTVKALVAYNGTAASAVLSASTTYVRADGVVVGTGSDLSTTYTALKSGIWQTGAGSYIVMNPSGGGIVWTGSSAVSTAGASAGSCTSWGGTSGNGYYGLLGLSGEWNYWWYWGSSLACSTAANVYCVEQ